MPRPVKTDDQATAERWTPLWWSALALLLTALLAGALSFDRRVWGGFVGDEATYLMAAQSLAYDGDLVYSAADYQRFVATWGRPPDGSILQRGSSGLLYAKEVIYPLALAPLMRWAPTRAAPIVNALALALASVLAARALRRPLGPAAPLWVAVLVFGSVTFAHVFWAHADLLLFCLVVSACALLRSAPDGDAGAASSRFALRFAAAGLLLGAVTAARPLYLPLLVAAAFLPPPARRRAGLFALAAGALVPFALAGWLNLATRGTLTSYQGERRAFYSYTGFPEVDLPADAWESHALRQGSGSWLETPAPQLKFITAQQLGWNAVYFLLGRAVGVLPYFLPVIVLLARFRRGDGRLALLIAAASIALLFLLIRPFNFWGGGGALANRYFLPVYGALWFAAGRTGTARWPLLAAVAAAPFLWPLWLAPRAFPIAADGTWRYVSPFARSVLPHETTQNHLKPGGREDEIHHGLWIKFLSPSVRAESADTLVLAGRDGEILVGFPQPLPALTVELVAAGLTDGLRFSGSATGEIAASPGHLDSSPTPAAQPTAGNAGNEGRLAPLRVRARHPMWWTQAPYYLYQFQLTRPPGAPPGDLRFRLRPG